MEQKNYKKELIFASILGALLLLYIIFIPKDDFVDNRNVISAQIDSLNVELNTLRGEATSLNFWISGMKEDGKTFPIIIREQVYSYYNTKDKKHLDSLLNYAEKKSKEYSNIEGE